MKIIGNKMNAPKQRKNTYYAGVALVALMCSTAISQAMDVEEDKDLSRVSCLWNLREKNFRTSALEILEKKVLNGSSQNNPKLRINYLKKLGEFLKDNPSHTLNLDMLKPGIEKEESPLSKFYNETLAHIMQSSRSPAEEALQTLKLKIFFSRLPQELAKVNMEGFMDEINKIGNSLVTDGTIEESKIDYFMYFYTPGNHTVEELEKIKDLTVNCSDLSLKAKNNFKFAFTQSDTEKKIACLKSIENDNHLAKYHIAELCNINPTAEAYHRYRTIVQENVDSTAYPLAAYRLAKFHETGFKRGRTDLPINSEKALKLLIEAANLGHPYAQYELALKWHNKEVMPGIETKETNKWFFKQLEQSASSGYSKAQLLLAQQKERDGIKDADRWYKKAADQGEEKAFYSAGSAYETEENPNYEKAISFYKKSEDPRASLRLGEMYLEGKGVDKSDILAKRYFDKAANQDNADGSYSLGLMNFRGQGANNPNLAEAFDDFITAANQGHSKALFQLGVMKQFGIGANQNYSEAADFYEKAAQQKHAQATYELGCLYNQGLGVKHDTAQALDRWEKAAKLKHTEAAYKAGKGCLSIWSDAKDEQIGIKAKTYLEQAAGLEHIDSLYWLGIMYELGRVVKKDPTQAIRYYEEAAKAGHPSAQFNLGQLYKADPVKKDEAFGCFESAAEQYHVGALRVLQDHYLIKEAKTKDDLVETFKITQALSQYSELGVINQLAKNGHSNSIKWLQKKASKGNPHAQWYYGKLLEQGIVLKQDMCQAIDLYQCASAQGNLKAKHRLVKFEQLHILGIKANNTSVTKPANKLAMEAEPSLSVSNETSVNHPEEVLHSSISSEAVIISSNKK